MYGSLKLQHFLFFPLPPDPSVIIRRIDYFIYSFSRHSNLVKKVTSLLLFKNLVLQLLTLYIPVGFSLIREIQGKLQ